MPEAMVDIDTLPEIATAKLPATYEQAKNALATCQHIDECKDWANKAEALASYARQSEDESLFKMATRIKARAIRRCGELLREIEPKHTGRPPEIRDGDGHNSRKQAARDAGLSERQQKQALRVANVPEDEFEQQLESDAPPTVTQLADQGTHKKQEPIFDLEGINPEDFQVATHVLGTVHEFCRHTEKVDFHQAARGLKAKEKPELGRQIALAQQRLTALEQALCTVPQI